MNKQEAIEKLTEIANGTGWISHKSACNVVVQIHEPQKVVIPKFVAEWLKEYRYANTLLKVLNAAEDERIVPSAVNDWILDNQRDFVIVWHDGYEVEKERLYTVEIPSITDGMNMLHHSDNDWYFDEDINNSTSGDSRYHTKFDIEQAGFGWVFDCNGVKVVEVEDER
ncbi:DUF1642 domain-containing protein [Streptococcus suis]|uniref:DUF1642 domain-containing protein n=1 Tax=Streptococcus suis TaxID=1307 RepID=UPI001EE97A10|nr:DUF1642 domain-containing protein [Streptococcus suis]